MWPDNEAVADCLDFEHLVGAVTSIIRNEQLLPTTIGVFGDWGSGKSSLLRMIERELGQDEGVLCLTFNGWLFEGYADAKSALMGTILEEISERRTLGSEAKRLLKNLLKRVDWMHLAAVGAKNALAFTLGGPAALSLSLGSDLVSHAGQLAAKSRDVESKDLEALGAAVKESWQEGQQVRRDIRAFHTDFTKLLKETDIRTLVVFIDDLDRCTPDTVIETLEAIRLFLFVPRTAFVLGADERLIKYAVRRRFPELPGERVEVGRDYLEKMVQFPVRVPALGRAELETYINLLFAGLALSSQDFERARARAIARGSKLHEVSFNYGIAQEMFGALPTELAEGLMLAERVAPVLASGLNGNPRQCKRFLNTMLMRIGMAKSRSVALQKTVLVKLMLLEYFRPEWFRRLAEVQFAQDGQPIELTLLEELAGGNTSARSRMQVPDEPNDTPSQGSKKRVGARAGTAQPPRAAVDDEPPKLLDDEFKAWLLDSWMRDWLIIDPKICDTDLRPYFYFSRDNLGPLAGAVRRMSPLAQEVLSKLLSPSEGVRLAAHKGGTSMAPGDAAAVFEALADRARREEDLGASDAVFPRLFDWAKTRPELRGQLITLLGQLPEPAMPPTAVIKLQRMTENDAQLMAASSSLLRRWAESNSNPTLARLAKTLCVNIGETLMSPEISVKMGGEG